MVGALLLRAPGVMDWHTTMRTGRILVVAAAMVPTAYLSATNRWESRSLSGP